MLVKSKKQRRRREKAYTLLTFQYNLSGKHPLCSCIPRRNWIFAIFKTIIRNSRINYCLRNVVPLPVCALVNTIEKGSKQRTNTTKYKKRFNNSNDIITTTVNDVNTVFLNSFLLFTFYGAAIGLGATISSSECMYNWSFYTTYNTTKRTHNEQKGNCQVGFLLCSLTQYQDREYL